MEKENKSIKKKKYQEKEKKKKYKSYHVSLGKNVDQ